MAAISRTGRWASGLALLAAVIVACLVLLPSLFGWQRYAIVSGSMTGTYDRGTLVLDEVVPVSDLPAPGPDFTPPPPSPGTSFPPAADFNPVATPLNAPGTPLRGTVSLPSTSSSERGIASVRYQTSPAGAGTWTDACTGSTAP